MREAADSLLYHDGFKSFSHEASIVYLLKKGFNEHDVSEFDRFRKIRNAINITEGIVSSKTLKRRLKWQLK